MAQIETGQAFAFIALQTSSRVDTKGQNELRSALLYSHSSGAQVARQRCPILRSSERSVSDCLPFEKGTSLLWIFGDISTLA